MGITAVMMTDGYHLCVSVTLIVIGWNRQGCFFLYLLVDKYINI
jgi:hypothetical protein